MEEFAVARSATCQGTEAGPTIYNLIFMCQDDVVKRDGTPLYIFDDLRVPNKLSSEGIQEISATVAAFAKDACAKIGCVLMGGEIAQIYGIEECYVKVIMTAEKNQ